MSDRPIGDVTTPARFAQEVVHVDPTTGLPYGSSSPQPVTASGIVANPSANFSRPADTTAYASGDLVANSTTAGSVAALSLAVGRIAAGSFFLRRCKLHKSGTGLTNASFRAHFFLSSPTCANGDNGAYSTSGVADYLGAMDVTIDRAFTDGAAGYGTPTVGAEIAVKLASGTAIFALIEARAAYTPGNAEVFTLTLDDWQN